MQPASKLATIIAALGLMACSSTNFGAASSTAKPASSGDAAPAAPSPVADGDPAVPGTPATAPTTDAAANGGAPLGTTTANLAASAPASAPASGSTATVAATGFPLGTITVPAATAPSYVNTASQLYSFSPTTDTSTLIGTFKLNGSAQNDIYDIAIDMTGHMFAVTPTDLYVVNPQTAALTHLMSHNISNANGLTCLSTGAIVIAGTSVAYIDPTSLATKQLVAAGQYTSSGDVIALPNNEIYWTTTDFAGDDLVMINPSTGAAKVVGNTGVTGIYGLGYAAGNLYGFVNNGEIVTIDPATGKVLTHVANTGSQAWDGATTNPVVWTTTTN